jgi:hypothetical protein
MQYGPLGYDMSYDIHKNIWKTQYNADKYPVLAFTGILLQKLYQFKIFKNYNR